jgi:hypothetical protein
MVASIVHAGCLCGAVRYEATGEPYNITHCHCADCRESSGAPFVSWASFRRRNFDSLHDMREPETRNDLSAMRLGALAIRAQAVGAFAVGALALGALALGAVAIGRLAIGRARIKRMEIDELVVKKIRITDSLKTPGNDESGLR